MRLTFSLFTSIAFLTCISCKEEKTTNNTQEEISETQTHSQLRSRATGTISNMKNLFIASTNYAMKNDKRFPESLSKINDSAYIDADQFENFTTYTKNGIEKKVTLIAGQTLLDPSTRILLYIESPEKNKTIVCYVSGAVYSVPTAEFEKQLKEQQAATNRE